MVRRNKQERTFIVQTRFEIIEQPSDFAMSDKRAQCETAHRPPDGKLIHSLQFEETNASRAAIAMRMEKLPTPWTGCSSQQKLARPLTLRIFRESAACCC